VAILKIMSALEIGPKTVDTFGFDMIVNMDSIEFFMETCKTESN
jgi:hypothetical protein